MNAKSNHLDIGGRLKTEHKEIDDYTHQNSPTSVSDYILYRRMASWDEHLVDLIGDSIAQGECHRNNIGIQIQLCPLAINPGAEEKEA